MFNKSIRNQPVSKRLIYGLEELCRYLFWALSRIINYINYHIYNILQVSRTKSDPYTSLPRRSSVISSESQLSTSSLVGCERCALRSTKHSQTIHNLKESNIVLRRQKRLVARKLKASNDLISDLKRKLEKSLDVHKRD